MNELFLLPLSPSIGWDPVSLQRKAGGVGVGCGGGGSGRTLNRDDWGEVEASFSGTDSACQQNTPPLHLLPPYLPPISSSSSFSLSFSSSSTPLTDPFLLMNICLQTGCLCSACTSTFSYAHTQTHIHTLKKSLHKHTVPPQCCKLKEGRRPWMEAAMRTKSTLPASRRRFHLQ